MSSTKTLTPEQAAEIPRVVERWRAALLSTQPADAERARLALREFYRVFGLRPPRLVLFFSSPLACHFGRALVQALTGEEKDMTAEGFLATKRRRVEDRFNKKEYGIALLECQEITELEPASAEEEDVGGPAQDIAGRKADGSKQHAREDRALQVDDREVPRGAGSRD